MKQLDLRKIKQQMKQSSKIIKITSNPEKNSSVAKNVFDKESLEKVRNKIGAIVMSL